MEYDVKISSDLPDLIRQINEALDEAYPWRLQGGIAMTAIYYSWDGPKGTDSNTEYQYAQAMVR